MSLVIEDPIDATNESQLIESIFNTTEKIVWVNRLLFISAIGSTLANKFLPPLQEYVSINTDDVETNIRAYRPDLIPPTVSS